MQRMQHKASAVDQFRQPKLNSAAGPAIRVTIFSVVILGWLKVARNHAKTYTTTR
jgi:hypothetical protein